jgi:VWFA-related protein
MSGSVGRSGARTLSLVASLAATVLVSAPAAQQPTFRASVDLIAVDVQVVNHDGKPLTGVTSDKFDVTIDGRRRKVVSVDLVQHAQRAESASSDRPITSGPVASNYWPTSEPVGRTFVLAIDAGSFSIGDSRGAAQAARSFVERLLPGDLVGLYTFPLGPRVDPTGDRAAVRRGLDGVVGTRQSLQSQFNLTASEVVDINAEVSAMGMRSTPPPTSGRSATPSPLLGNETETLRRVQIRECGSDTDLRCIESIETEAQAMGFFLEGEVLRGLNGLETLLRGLGDYPGRKTVIVLSAGMPVSDRVGGRPNIGDQARVLGEQAARANATIYALHIDNNFLKTFSAETRKTDKMPVSRERESALQGRLLDQFAGASGGTLMRILVGSGEGALDQILRETSAYYLLGVQPADSDRDGRTHVLKVKVDAPDATVRSRTWVLVPKKRI